MDETARALLLVGSPRGVESTSYSLGSYLLERLSAKGFQTHSVTLYLALRNEDRFAELLSAADTADLIVLAFPLYVDSLPAAVIRALERIAKHRQTAHRAEQQRFAAICNSGFPEAVQSRTALAICRRFAREVGLEWAGGLALGGGEAIHGRPLKETGRMVRNVILSLDLAADSLALHESIPARSVELMEKPLVPSWLYRFMGNHSWKRDARKYGAQDRLHDRPYLQAVASSSVTSRKNAI